MKKLMPIMDILAIICITILCVRTDSYCWLLMFMYTVIFVTLVKFNKSEDIEVVIDGWCAMIGSCIITLAIWAIAT